MDEKDEGGMHEISSGQSPPLLSNFFLAPLPLDGSTVFKSRRATAVHWLVSWSSKERKRTRERDRDRERTRLDGARESGHGWNRNRDVDGKAMTDRDRCGKLFVARNTEIQRRELGKRERKQMLAR